MMGLWGLYTKRARERAAYDTEGRPEVAPVY